MRSSNARTCQENVTLGYSVIIMMHTAIAAVYGRDQFKLYKCVLVHACTCMFTACETLKNCAHALLHTILVCTRLAVNTCDSQVLHVTSSHLVCCATR